MTIQGRIKKCLFLGVKGDCRTSNTRCLVLSELKYCGNNSKSSLFKNLLILGVLFKQLLLLYKLQIKSMSRKDNCDILGLAGLVVAGAGLVLAYLQYKNQCNC